MNNKYIEQARTLREEYLKTGNASGVEAIEKIFPELAESEDEKIRKELLAFIQDRAAKYHNDPKYVNIDSWIAWLEKAR